MSINFQNQSTKHQKSFQVLYDHEKCEYYGREAKKMLKETIKVTQDDNLSRTEMIKSLCRFCFKNNDCLPFNHYKSHEINFFEVIDFFEIDKRNENSLNEIICSSCFKKIQEFDKFRSKCQKSYKKLIEELKKFGKAKTGQQGNFFIECKTEPADDPFDGQTDVEDNYQYDDTFIDVNNTENSFNTSKTVTGSNNSSKIQTTNQQVNDDSDADSDDTTAFQEILFKKTLNQKIEEAKNKLRGNLEKPNAASSVKKEPEVNIQEFSDDDFGVNDMSFGNDGFDSTDDDFFDELPAKKQKLDNEAKPENKIIEKQPEESSEKPKKKNPFAEHKTRGKKSFQCFFCREKFYGVRVYERHNCDRKIKCALESCDLEFTNTGGYNIHIFYKHKLPKVHKEYCPSCNTVFQMNAIEFKDHCEKCSIEKNFADNEIKCLQCDEKCQNIRIYAAHKLMHENENLKKVEEKEEAAVPVKKKSKYRKSPRNKICDLCGKTFDGPGLYKHKLNVHLVGFDGQMFHCDLCPIAKPTKQLLQNHVRRTHVIKWKPCPSCGKMFKNQDTWKAHQKVHTNSKDDNRCDICPSAPGFYTQTQLKQHMAAYHGGEQPVRNFFCNICGNGYSRDDQLVRHLATIHQMTQNNYTEDVIRQLMKNKQE